MRINETEFNADLWDILTELQSQLKLNGLDMLGRMKQSGHNVQVCCPYHHDTKPSAGLDMRTGMFHCFACGEVHTLPEFISYCFGKDDMLGNKFGWNWLLKNFLTISVEERKDIPLDFERKALYNVNVNVEYVSEEELDSYRYTHPYMYRRGLTDEVIELFDIGYDSSSDCITFPVRDIRGNTLFIARRSTKTKFFNYPKNVEKPLYGLYEYYQCKLVKGNPNKATSVEYTEIIYPQEVIVCESMLDALSFWTVHKPAVALNGLGNALQMQQLRNLPCRELILCTDMDEAGLKARERIKANVKNKLISQYLLPDGRKDANECTKEELMLLEPHYL